MPTQFDLWNIRLEAVIACERRFVFCICFYEYENILGLFLNLVYNVRTENNVIKSAMLAMLHCQNSANEGSFGISTNEQLS